MTTHQVPVGAFRMFFGPPRTRAETILGWAGSASVSVLLAAYIWRLGGWNDRSALQIVALAVIVVDLVAGIFTTCSGTAKAWYHRPGLAARRFRLGFVVVHLSYLVIAAALFEPGWAWALANGALMLSAAAAIESAPASLKRLVAAGVVLTAVLVNLIWLPLPAALAWLPALLFVKVLGCFLVPG